MTDVIDQAMLGFRRWTIGQNGLLARGGWWESGVNTSKCLRRDPDMLPLRHGIQNPPVDEHVPSHACSCGLYAWHTLEQLTRRTRNDLFAGSGRPLQVFGAVAGWGAAVVHHTGWRAQYARILALAVATDTTPFGAALAAGAAEYHEVPLVPYGMLQLEGARHAATVPEALRPNDGPSNHVLAFGQSLRLTKADLQRLAAIIGTPPRVVSITTAPDPPQRQPVRKAADAPLSIAARYQREHAAGLPQPPRRPPRTI